VLLDGQILDGRGRLRACLKEGKEPTFDNFNGDDPIEFVWRKNFARRHLTRIQKLAALYAYKELLEKDAQRRMRRGTRIVAPSRAADPDTNSYQGSASSTGRTLDKLAAMAGLGHGTVQAFDEVARKAPDLMPAVADGSVRPSTAAGIAKDPALLAEVRSGDLTVAEAAEVVRQEGHAARKAKANSTSQHRGSVNDPVSELVGIGVQLRKIAPKVEGLTPSECRGAPGLAKAINTLGFAFTELIPTLLRTGDADAIELAEKTIATLAGMSLDPVPDGPGPGGQDRRQDAAPTAAPEKRSAPCDPAALDWPRNPGIKVVMDAPAMMKAIKRASLAALTEEGQSEMRRASNETRGCVRITASSGKIAFESGVSTFSVRHIVPAGVGAAIVAEGETCVPAKDLKRIIKECKGASTLSLAFVPAPPDPAMSPEARAIMPDGAVEIGLVTGGRTIAKSKVESYRTAGFVAPEYADEASLTLLLAGRVASVRAPYNAVSFCINRKDQNGIYDKLAIFTNPNSVFFLGADGRRCAVVQANADSFDRFVGKELKAPVLVDDVFAAPILRSLSDKDPIMLGIEQGTQNLHVVSGRTTYRVCMVPEAERMKYPNYRRLVGMETGAVVVVNRQELVGAMRLLNMANFERSRHTFCRDPEVLKVAGRGVSSIKEATGQIPYRPVGEPRLKDDTITFRTDFLVEGLKGMSAENVRMTFTPDEMRVKIEDEIDPKFAYYVQVRNANEA
jgi:DNA polymerase III sliding clamp (beta) subunit (PCNA family)